MHVLGRRSTDPSGPAGRLGRYRAADGSDGAPVHVDLDRPHAGLVVGKRGYGKTYTLGVLAEEAARAPGVAPVVVDPMGALTGLAAGPSGGAASTAGDADGSAGIEATVVAEPTVPATAVPPALWPELLGLEPTGAAGALVWQAAADAETLAGVQRGVRESGADENARRAAENHLQLAASWGVFDPDGIDAGDLLGGEATVLDLSALATAPAAAVVAAVARALYRARAAGRTESDVEQSTGRLPWLFVDEAHAFFDSVASAALCRVVTRGRGPGTSFVAATQRPRALPEVVRSQADLLVAHRLTAEPDVEALAAATPTYLDQPLRDRLPATRGCAVVIDDATEAVHGVSVRRRDTPHRGGSPRASDAGNGDGAGNGEDEGRRSSREGREDRGSD